MTTQPGKRPSIPASILMLIGIVTLFSSIFGIINAVLDLGITLEIYGADLELPDDVTGNVMLLVIGVLFFVIGKIISLKRTRELFRRHKWPPVLILIAFFVSAFFGIKYLNVLSMGGWDLSAAQTNDPEALKQLYDEGKVKAAKTALLERALYYNSTDVVGFLISRGADINQKGNDGNPLIFRAIRANDKILSLVLDRANPDLSVTDSGGNSVLIALINNPVRNESGMIEFAKRLLKMNVDKYKKNKKGETAFEIAKARYYSKLADVLK